VTELAVLCCTDSSLRWRCHYHKWWSDDIKTDASFTSGC